MYSRVGDSFGRNERTDTAGPPAEELEDVLDDPTAGTSSTSLREEGESVGELVAARRVVARITGTAPEDVGDDVQRRVQTWLHHGQLPVLDEYGIVEFDADAGEVSLGRTPRP